VNKLLQGKEPSRISLPVVYYSLEGAILHWVVFHHQRKPFLVGIQRESFRHRPTLQDAIEFQPKNRVQAGSLVLLHDQNERALNASPQILALLGTAASL
jgi:hypothetical protein